jgi:hypothetical protein
LGVVRDKKKEKKGKAEGGKADAKVRGCMNGSAHPSPPDPKKTWEVRRSLGGQKVRAIRIMRGGQVMAMAK